MAEMALDSNNAFISLNKLPMPTGKIPIAVKDNIDVQDMITSAGSLDLENNLTATLGLNVLIDHKGKKGGSIKIEYKTLDQLETVTRKLKN